MNDPKKSGTIYDAGLRERQSTGGETGVGIGKGHQWYGDEYIFSRDPLRGDHWTNTDRAKGSPGRHQPPPDVKP